ncbi:MAG: TlpA family protein disulfide reductase [Burkholderiaceae bacterium]
MSRSRTWLVVAVALTALFAGLLVAVQRYSPNAPGASAEAFFAQTFKDLDGEPRAMAAWQGQLVVLNFWATWCPPCVEEMPDLQRVHDEYRSRDVVVIGLGIDNPSALKRFQDEYNLALPLFAAGAAGSELAKALGNSSGALPYTLLIDRKGRIVHARLGQIRPAELRSWLDAQLGR